MHANFDLIFGLAAALACCFLGATVLHLEQQQVASEHLSRPACGYITFRMSGDKRIGTPGLIRLSQKQLRL